MESVVSWPMLIAVAAVTDLLSRRIPNWLNLPLLAAGLILGGVTDVWRA